MRKFITIFCLATLLSVHASESETTSDDMTAPVATESTDSVKSKPGFFRRAYNWVYNYIDSSNEVRSDKRFDISVVGGPKYSSSRSFGLAAVAQGVYSMAPGDSLTPMSSVSIKADASLSGYYELGVEGVNIFKGDRYRLSYDCIFSSERAKFWGIGYDMATNDDNESKYSMRKGIVNIEFSIELVNNLYLAPRIMYAYVGGRRFVKPELWEGMPTHTNSVAPGLSVIYDTRDNMNSTYRGLYVELAQQFFPRVFNGNHNFSSTGVTIKYFTGLWHGCILATRLRGEFTYGHTPWTMLPQFGGSKSMRGYYEGRFRDKDLLEATVELRQNIWKRSGVAAWVGAASVAPELSAFRWRKVLPNWGIGYRFEFKHRINARLDIGFGRGCKSIELSLNEAF